MEDYTFKFILLGDYKIGKTSILNRFVSNNYDEYHHSTIGVDFGNKIINIDDKKIKLLIWDTAGQERFMAITKSYIKYTTCAFLIFDLTNRSSFINLDKWLNLIIDNTLLIYLIGNKHDQNNNVITQQEIYEYADKHNLIYYETSAKKNYNSSNTPVISNSLQSSQYTSVYNIEYIFVNAVQNILKKISNDKIKYAEFHKFGIKTNKNNNNNNFFDFTNKTNFMSSCFIS